MEQDKLFTIILEVKRDENNNYSFRQSWNGEFADKRINHKDVIETVNTAFNNSVLYQTVDPEHKHKFVTLFHPDAPKNKPILPTQPHELN